MPPALPSRLPSLRALLAFEATARHQRLAGAAAELNLTVSAVSHAVRGLEAQLGVKLFRRTRDGVALTTAGHGILLEVRQGLELLGGVFQPPQTEPRGRLMVSVISGFASGWLAPRLGRLRQSIPELELSLLISDELVDFGVERTAHAAIRYGRGEWPGLEAVRIRNEETFPVASPSYRAGRLPSTPEDLLECDLIQNPWEPWEPWFERAGVEGPWRAVVEIADTALAVLAAAEGSGVALARGTVAASALESGRLVRLFDIAAPSEDSYWLAWPQGSRKRGLIGRLETWLNDEAADEIGTAVGPDA